MKQHGAGWPGGHPAPATSTHRHIRSQTTHHNPRLTSHLMPAHQTKHWVSKGDTRGTRVSKTSATGSLTPALSRTL